MKLASLLQLVSPALPIGGFTWSRGLESAVERGRVHDAASARAWIEGGLRSVVVHVDAPIVARAHRAWSRGDDAAVRAWSERAQAMRETAELRLESRASARALMKLAMDLGWVARDARRDAGGTPAVPGAAISARELACQACAFAIVAAQLELDEGLAVRGYLWTWLESSVSAAVKLVPLGQTDGQRILRALAASLDELAERALALPDDELGALVHGLAIASALHETQHTRLFRS